jgi:hypothetical protein
MSFIYQVLHKKNSRKEEEEARTHKHQERRQGGDAPLVAAWKISEGAPMRPRVRQGAPSRERGANTQGRLTRGGDMLQDASYTTSTPGSRCMHMQQPSSFHFLSRFPGDGEKIRSHAAERDAPKAAACTAASFAAVQVYT